MTGILQVVKREDVLHLSLGVDDGAGAVLDARLDLLGQELVQVVRLLKREQGRQVLEMARITKVSMTDKHDPL